MRYPTEQELQGSRVIAALKTVLYINGKFVTRTVPGVKRVKTTATDKDKMQNDNNNNNGQDVKLYPDPWTGQPGGK